MVTEKDLSQEQCMAIKLAIDCMDRNFKRNYNKAIFNREMGVRVEFGQAINILEDMITIKSEQPTE